MAEAKRRGYGDDGSYFDHRADCRDSVHHRTCAGRWLKAAVHLVAGGEPRVDAPVVRVLRQMARELRLRGEHDLVRDSGQLAALLVGGPARGQVQGPAERRDLRWRLIFQFHKPA